VLLPYSSERVAKIKTVAGRRWHQGEKYWTIPHTDSALAYLRTLFAGEPLEVDPSLHPLITADDRESSWKRTGDQSNATDVKLLDQIRQAIRARHFSHRTEDALLGGQAIHHFPSGPSASRDGRNGDRSLPVVPGQ
jgi:hypothetical protein